MAVWLSPVPIEIPVAIFTSLLLSRLTSMTESLPYFQSLGEQVTVALQQLEMAKKKII